MSSLIQWIIREQKTIITTAEEQDIIASIGCLSEMTQSVTHLISANSNSDNDTANLALTAALLAELISELNRLLQKPAITDQSVTRFN